MEDKAIETWECPHCHATGNSAKFCAKCGTEKPVSKQTEEDKAAKKEKSRRVIETIVAVAMILFFSISLVLVLCPMVSVYGSSSASGARGDMSYDVYFYYFFYTQWVNLKTNGGVIEIIQAVISTIAFIAAVGLTYFFGIKGLIDSIKVIKTHKEPKYTKDMMAVIGTMFGYYAIVTALHNISVSTSTTNLSGSDGAAIILFVMTIVFMLAALMARTFVFAVIDKKGFKIAATVIKFVSIIFIISAVTVAAKVGMEQVASTASRRLTFVNWSLYLILGSDWTGAAVTSTIAAVTGLAAMATGIGALVLSYGSLMDDEKDFKASVFSIAFCALLFITIALSTATFFAVPEGQGTFMPTGTPASIILSLLGIIGIVVASALEKEKKVAAEPEKVEKVD